MESEKIGAIASSITTALREQHSDVALDEVIAAWTEIGRTIPLAYSIHEAIEDGLEKAVKSGVKQALDRLLSNAGLA